MKRILVLGGNELNRPIYTQLREAGFFTIAADRDPVSPAASLASAFSPTDISDIGAICRLSRELEVDGVMPINEYGVRSAARAAAELGLVPGLSVDRAAYAVDKGLMRKVWRKERVPQPAFFLFGTPEELKSRADDLGYPCIVKPRESGGGGRGISVLRSKDDLNWSFEYASRFRKGDDRPYVVEEFMDGLEVTVESIVRDGAVTHLTMSDKVKPPLRTRVATSLNYPAAVADTLRRTIEEVTTQAIRAIGIRNGMAHSELILTDRGPMMVELGARGGGGHIFHTIIEAVTGLKAPVAAAHILTGGDVSLNGLTQAGAVYRFFTPPRGILRAVRGLETARAIPGVLDLGLMKRIGDEVGLNNNSMDRAGYIVTGGRTRTEAISIADSVEANINLVVE